MRDLKEALERAGLTVIEVDGWRDRGSSSFNPRGSVNHHTAGPERGFAPSLNICINGRSDVPGPLCNVHGPREESLRVHLVAAGRANHAGKGGFRGLTGNSSVLGLEEEHCGYPREPISELRKDRMARVHAAFAWAAGFDADMTCFTEDTLVLTRDGQRSIKDLAIGEEVYTHNHRWRKITAKQEKFDDTITLKGQGHPGIETTKNHPFLSYGESRGRLPHKNQSCNNLRVHGQEWVNAEEMAGRFWASPVEISGNDDLDMPFEPSYDIFYFVGRWLGDGPVSNSSVVISGHLDEVAEIEDSFRKIDLSPQTYRRSGLAVQVQTSNKQIVEWLTEHFSKGAAHKGIPAWVYGLQADMRQAILDGYLDSDGHYRANGLIEANTVSKKLAIGIKLLAQTLGHVVNLHIHTPPSTKVIEGRTVNQLPYWQLRITPGDRNNRYNAPKADGFTLSRCKSIMDGSLKKVYDITVDEDHSFIADGIVVHNCQHHEWTTRKIDFVKAHMDPNDFRARVARHLARMQGGTSPAPTPTPIEDRLIMNADDERKIEAIVKRVIGDSPAWALMEVAEMPLLIVKDEKKYMWLTNGLHARKFVGKEKAEELIKRHGLHQKYANFPVVKHDDMQKISLGNAY